MTRLLVSEKHRYKRKRALLAAIGLWKDRTDLPDTKTYVRKLRSDDRLKRLPK